MPPGSDERFPTAQPPAGVGTDVPSPARVYDVWLGGKDNYAVDRLVAEQTVRAVPDTLISVRDNRDFLIRAVRHLTREAGIRQFVDLGSGLPTMVNTHEAAQEIAPDARVVYVDNDPVVRAHGRALLATNGNTRVIEADLRDPDSILGHPDLPGLIDLTQPVAFLLVAVMHFVPDEQGPDDIVARYRSAMSPGSYLVLSHLTDDDDPVRGKKVVDPWGEQQAPVPPIMRSHDRITRFFAGLETLEPGVVPIHRWRPEPTDPFGGGENHDWFWLYGGVGRN